MLRPVKLTLSEAASSFTRVSAYVGESLRSCCGGITQWVTIMVTLRLDVNSMVGKREIKRSKANFVSLRRNILPRYAPRFASP